MAVGVSPMDFVIEMGQLSRSADEEYAEPQASQVTLRVYTDLDVV